jgi:uncharacterized protein
MAQASNAQREPSMEEILASIRRIIEDNDPGSANSQQNEEAAPSPQAERPQAASNGAATEVEAFRDSIEGDAPVERPRSAQPAEVAGSRTMSDLQASLQEPAEKGEVVRMPVAAASPAVTGEAGPASLAAPATPLEAGSSTGGLELGHSAPASQPASLGGQSFPDAQASAPRKPVAEVEGKPEANETPPAIISEKAGRQVAAAFEELSEAFAASRQRSFDEMAEEMLRPMLREWMDNNLPVLVERLVREEIERVARGVKR